MIVEKRGVGVAILLSIITCGFYAIYWEYTILRSLYNANKMENTAGMDIILSIVTCGIYGLYALYKAGKLESSARTLHGLPPKDDSVLYLLLGVLALVIISFAILQNNINSFADHVNSSLHDPQRRPL
ncbi:MAG: DUF4234 domain-containing protein [Defluviitaleaceae bacterium]|nr:DUF4234 domain-containing protein [Defluviitaleaceae bacterium]